MFRILKFLHFARDNGIPDIPVEDAAAILLTKMNIGNEVSGDHRSEASGVLESEISGDLVELLKLYRKLDRGIISYPLQ